MTVIDISEAKASLSRLVERAERGERIIIGRAGRPAAVLTARQGGTEPREPGGSCEGQAWIADDLDELPEELAEAFGVRDGE